jgi:hypothetical protein
MENKYNRIQQNTMLLSTIMLMKAIWSSRIVSANVFLIVHPTKEEIDLEAIV